MVRPAAVAGMFYPDDPDVLREDVDSMLAATQREVAQAVPKALVAPHAGYVYSGPVAATAYARLAPARGRIERVVLLGPAHRVALRGLALPEADAFETPLGTVPLDLDAMGAVPDVERRADAHAMEHSLEVHLPFLMRVLGEFSLVPFVVGHAAPMVVASVLDRLWGGPETLVVISSDLSHFLPYDDARAIDQSTVERIVALDERQLMGDEACGAHPINGLLHVARQRGLRAELLDLRNSFDTAGARRGEVVGYASIAFYERPAGDHHVH